MKITEQNGKKTLDLTEEVWKPQRTTRKPKMYNKIVANLKKHMQGKHDQASHGRKKTSTNVPKSKSEPLKTSDKPIRILSSNSTNKKIDQMTHKEVVDGIIDWSNGDPYHILKAMSSALEDSNAHSANEKLTNMMAGMSETKPINLKSKIAQLSESQAHHSFSDEFISDSTPAERSPEGLGILLSQHTFREPSDYEDQNVNFQAKGLVTPFLDALKNVGYPSEKLKPFFGIAGWNNV